MDATYEAMCERRTYLAYREVEATGTDYLEQMNAVDSLNPHTTCSKNA